MTTVGRNPLARLSAPVYKRLTFSLLRPVASIAIFCAHSTNLKLKLNNEIPT